MNVIQRVFYIFILTLLSDFKRSQTFLGVQKGKKNEIIVQKRFFMDMCVTVVVNKLIKILNVKFQHRIITYEYLLVEIRYIL